MQVECKPASRVHASVVHASVMHASMMHASMMHASVMHASVMHASVMHASVMHAGGVHAGGIMHARRTVGMHISWWVEGEGSAFTLAHEISCIGIGVDWVPSISHMEEVT
jgi:hypothetical protein